MFNTLLYARRLEEVGLSREQAEAHVQIIAEIIEGDVATKQDLNQGLKDLEHRLIVKLCTFTGAMLTLAVAVIAVIIKL